MAEKMSYHQLLERYPRFAKRTGSYFTIFEPPREEGLLSIPRVEDGYRVCPLCWHRLEECVVHGDGSVVMVDYLCVCGAVVREVVRARFVSDKFRGR